MGRVPNLNRITTEDFAQEDQALVSKMAFPINTFMEQVANVLDKRIDFDNLNQEIITMTVTVDSTGNPLTPAKYKSDLLTRIQGMTCIRCQDLDSPGTPPVNTPFATFVQSTSIVSVSNIKGLTANTRYRLTFLIFG